MVDHSSGTTPTSHRAVHQLGAEASAAYEDAGQGGGVSSAHRRAEVVFTKNATEALNLVAYTLARAEAPWRSAGATRSSSPTMEHHSNIVPWQLGRRAHGRDAALSSG